MEKRFSSPMEVLRNYFGYTAFRGHQKEIIDAVLNGRDVFVLMPTGGGKSICFQVPALLKEGICIVISPLIALMKDQVESLKINGVDAAYLNSSLDTEEEFQLFQKLRSGSIRILYMSPERALSFSPSLWKDLNVSLIAVDEAHCVSQWGHDFRPEYTRIKELRKQLGAVPMIALTASADKLSRKDILQYLGLQGPAIFISSFDRPNLRLMVRTGLKTADKNELLFSFLSARRSDAGIIYCLSRKLTEDLSLLLRQRGIRNAFYHAGMDVQERMRVQEAFLNEEITIICATIAFGMGIDKSNVRWVVHYNLPRNMESYYQEIGRAGRDGLPGDTLLMSSLRDLSLLSFFARQSAQSELQFEKVQRMQQYTEARICRRKLLLAYFGELLKEDCGNCDVCLHPPKYSDHTASVRKILQVIRMTRESVATGMLVSILRGVSSDDLRSNGFHLSGYFGSGKERPQEEWIQMILQLIGIGMIDIAYDEHNHLKLTSEANSVLDTGKRVLLSEIPHREQIRESFQLLPDANSESDVFNRLRELRLKIAREEKLAPYIIFHDKTLRELAEKLPVNKEELLQISGISERKYDKYGERLLKLLVSSGE